MQQTAIKPKERDQLFQALRAGVTPRIGLRHIQVGRAREIAEVARDLDRIGEGGTAFRIVTGAYGSGKTFFLNLARLAALEKRLVTLHADLGPERRLHSTSGQARALMAELARNLATRSRPEGGALESVLQKLVMDCRAAAETAGGDFDRIVAERLAPALELAGGYDAVTVIRHYAQADTQGDRDAKDACLRWLRAEYATKTEARSMLPVREIVTDADLWDHVKLLGVIAVAAGYAGVALFVDEMVNLYKIPSPQARNANYEEILRILNDLLQGSAAHVGVFMGGTPEFLMDGRRGLHSYEALRSRLAENSFAGSGLVDLSGPVLRLQNLSPEDLYVLLLRLRAAFNAGLDPELDLPDDALQAFMAHCDRKIGAAYFQTPRASIRAFVDLMEVMRQNPGTSWSDLIGALAVRRDGGAMPNDAMAEGTTSDGAAEEATAPESTATRPPPASELPLAAAGGRKTEGRNLPNGAGEGADSGGTSDAAQGDDRDDDLAAFRL